MVVKIIENALKNALQLTQICKAISAVTEYCCFGGLVNVTGYPPDGANVQHPRFD